MSESLQDLIDQAKLSGDWNPVTDWCETFDWPTAVGVPTAEFYLKCVYETSPDGETKLVEAVSAARAAGTPWSRIAQILNTTPQAAQKQFAPLIKSTEPAHQ